MEDDRVSVLVCTQDGNGERDEACIEGDGKAWEGLRLTRTEGEPPC
jgi:hypothetical protein